MMGSKICLLIILWMVFSATISEALRVRRKFLKRSETEELESNEIMGDANTGHKNHHGHWGYEDEGDWYKYHKECGGENQSPIDILNSDVRHMREFHEIFFSYKTKNETARVKNNGHTVAVSFNDGIEFVWKHLKNPYTVLGLHFHWGANDKEGSEHWIDGKKFPLEMHIVTYDAEKYGDIGEALGEKDSLSVYGVLFELSEEDNENLNPIIKVLEAADEQVSVDIKGLSLTDILPPNYSTRYYTYSGSLTTPPCSESVVWVLGKEKLSISPGQLEKFRNSSKTPGRPKVSDLDGKITYNWRGPQKLHGRRVYSTFPTMRAVTQGRKLQDQPSSAATAWHKSIFVFAYFLVLVTFDSF